MYNNTLTLSDIMKRQSEKITSGLTPSPIFVYECTLALNENDYKSRIGKICNYSEYNIPWFENNYKLVLDKLMEADKLQYDTRNFYRTINENILPHVDINVSNSIHDYIYENRSNPNINELIKTCDKNKVIDRLLWNHNAIKESISNIKITDNKPLETIVYEFYNSINSKLSTKSDTAKLFLCIEEAGYILDINRYNYDLNDLINEFADLFRLKDISEESITKVINNLNSGNIVLNESQDYASSDDVKKLIDRYKKQTKKDVSGIKRIVEVIFGKSPSQVIDEVPSVFKLIRMGLIVGSFSVSPLLGIVHFITDKWIEMSTTRNQCDRMYKIFNKEKERIDTKTMFDDEVSAKTKAYSKCLDECMDLIDEHRRKLFTDEEIYRENTMDESYELVYEILDKKRSIKNDYYKKLSQIETYCDKADLHLICPDDKIIDLLNDNEENICNFINGSNRLMIPLGKIKLFDITKDESDVTLIDHICDHLSNDKSVIIYNIIDEDGCVVYNLYYIYNKVIESDDAETEIKIENAFHVSDIELINTIVEYADLFDKSETVLHINDTLNEHIDLIKNNSVDISSFISENLFDIIGESYISILKHQKSITESSINKTELSWAIGVANDNNDSYKLNTFNTLQLQIESAEVLTQYLTENINKAALKMAGLNLSAKAKELSQKEKETSAKFNIIFSQFQKNLERSLTTDKRESIIKGSVVPSASKCIKLAVATGVAFLVNPALAVIGSLGALAISKKLTKRERQILMDEIQVELKYIEKEISQAESDGNSKKYKQLLLYQKKLQREYQRINYNIKVAGERVYKAEGPKEDD